MILFFVQFMQTGFMDWLPIIVFSILFLGLIGLGGFFALKNHARKKAQQNPFIRRDDDDDDDEPRGEKRHCDGYSVGTFYW